MRVLVMGIYYEEEFADNCHYSNNFALDGD
jgi:hypothetical protein